MEAVGANVADHGAGGGKRAGLHPVLQGFGKSCPDIRAGDVDIDDPNYPEPQCFQPQGVLSDDRTKTAATIPRGMIIPTPRGGYAGGQSGEYRYLHCSPSVQNFPIYCNQFNIGAVSES